MLTTPLLVAQMVKAVFSAAAANLHGRRATDPEPLIDDHNKSFRFWETFGLSALPPLITQGVQRLLAPMLPDAINPFLWGRYGETSEKSGLPGMIESWESVPQDPRLEVHAQIGLDIFCDVMLAGATAYLASRMKPGPERSLVIGGVTGLITWFRLGAVYHDDMAQPVAFGVGVITALSGYVKTKL